MLENITKPQTEWTCKVRDIRKNLDESDRKILDGMLRDPEWPTQTISNELAKYGILVSGHTIAKHRKGLCSCSNQ